MSSSYLHQRARQRAQEAFIDYLVLLGDVEAEVELISLLVAAKDQRFQDSNAGDRLGQLFELWQSIKVGK